MSDMAAAREKIEKVRDSLKAKKLYGLARKLDNALLLTFKEKALRRAPTKNKQLTPEQKAMVRRIAYRNSDMHQQTIAEKFKVNQGRISSALRERD